MHGFGSHTSGFINAKNERYWVKSHFVSQQGIRNLSETEVEAILGKDHESHERDLFENAVRSLGGAPGAIQTRHIDNYTKCDSAYGAGGQRYWVLGIS